MSSHSQSKNGNQTTSYFADMKRSEVVELITLLREATLERNKKKETEVIKRVIAYMTLGIDVSPIFPQMIMASNTTDLVQKKLVYLYLCNYAETHPDVSLLCINTLRKDCGNVVPKIRGLALRSLTSLRLPHLIEHILPPVIDALEDVAPYVRATAVMSIAKLHQLSPHVVLDDTRIVNKLYDMLRDTDASVIVNALVALDEILRESADAVSNDNLQADEQGIALNRTIAIHLLNKLDEFSEWGLFHVLDILSRWVPPEQELLDVMNLLDGCFSHSSSAVVLATSKLFIQYAEQRPQLANGVFQRIRIPLVTLLESSYDELSYALLSHVSVLLEYRKDLFETDFKHIYCRHNDAPYVKRKKIEILSAIASQNNMNEIVAELSAYVMDRNHSLGRLAIQSVASIAIRLPDVAQFAIDNLMTLIHYEFEYISAQIAIVCKDLLRRYPRFANSVVPATAQYLLTVDDQHAKASIIWMLGEYGEHIKHAPYLLEVITEDYEDQMASVKLQLLTASIKLFFKRPPEVKPWLGQLFEHALSDALTVNVHDKALLYWRLLSTNLLECSRVVCTDKKTIETFSLDNHTLEVVDQLMEEFNTLSIIYGKPMNQWIEASSSSSSQTLLSDNSSDDDYSSQDDYSSSFESSDEYSSEPDQAPPSSTPSTSTSSSPFVPDQGATLSAQQFQHLWDQSSVSGKLELTISSQRSLPPVSTIEETFSAKFINVMASGVVGNQTKVYLFAKDPRTASYVLVEMILDAGTRVLLATFKVSGSSHQVYSSFLTYFKQVLANL